MAFGLKKKVRPAEAAASAPEAPVEPSPSKRPAQKKRKPQELLSSVVNESAPGAAIDILKRNSAFALPNGTSWVGLLLSADSIGGLSQKQKGDATKGSIIELITADKIQVVATRAMLDEEFLGIIPTVETLERMEEYRLLLEAPYFWAVFRSEDDGEALITDAVQDVQATLLQAIEIAKGDRRLSDVLPQVWSWAGGENPFTIEAPAEIELALVGSAASSSDTDPLAGAFDFGSSSDDTDLAELVDGELDLVTGEVTDEEPALDFDAEQFEAQFGADDDDTTFDDSWQADDSGDGADPDGQAETGYYQYLQENRDRVVDEQEVRETIARRFLSSDLDLSVDLAEFETVFSTAPDAIALEVSEDPSDWLGSQVAQLSRQANAELAMLHRGHIDELREIFVETMALHVEQTMAAVSTDAPGSQYAELMAVAKHDFETRRQNSPQEIAEARRELTSRFEAAANARAEQAAAHARAVYSDKHRPKLERDLAEVGLDVDRRLEEQYAHDRQTVLELRRKDANVRMDVGTNRIFEHLRTVQGEQREAERALLEHWNEQLIRFIDENRKNDIARAMVLADELARTNQVEKLQIEHAAQLREVRQTHAEREEQLRQELERHRREALSELESRRNEWSTSLQIERERSSAGGALAEQLRVQIAELSQKYEDQYTSRIKTLEADKEAATLEIERAHAVQRRMNQVLVALIVVLTVAGIAVGVILGWGFAHKQDATTNQSAPAAAGRPLL